MDDGTHCNALVHHDHRYQNVLHAPHIEITCSTRAAAMMELACSVLPRPCADKNTCAFTLELKLEQQDSMSVFAVFYLGPVKMITLLYLLLT